MQKVLFISIFPYFLVKFRCVSCLKYQSDHDSFILRDAPQPYTSDEGYYHFLLGILNSERGGDRSFAKMYGFTEILPGLLTTDKIQDPNGNLVIDLASSTPTITARNGAKFVGTFEFESAKGLDATPEMQALAKQLGYADYATMKRDSDNGKTIIDGGYINADLVVAKQLSSIKEDAFGKPIQQVSITPESGMRFNDFKTGTANLLAEFSPRDVNNIESLVPLTPNIYITEYEEDLPKTFSSNTSKTLLTYKNMTTSDNAVTQQLILPTISLCYTYQHIWRDVGRVEDMRMDCSYALVMELRVMCGDELLDSNSIDVKFTPEDVVITEYDEDDGNGVIYHIISVVGFKSAPIGIGVPAGVFGACGWSS